MQVAVPVVPVVPLLPVVIPPVEPELLLLAVPVPEPEPDDALEPVEPLALLEDAVVLEVVPVLPEPLVLETELVPVELLLLTVPVVLELLAEAVEPPLEELAVALDEAELVDVPPGAGQRSELTPAGTQTPAWQASPPILQSESALQLAQLGLASPLEHAASGNAAASAKENRSSLT